MQTNSEHAASTKPEDSTQENPHPDSIALQQAARQASQFLKSLAHEQRLAILCRLSQGECAVHELEQLLGARQAAVSQQLSRLREDGLVNTRREGKTMYYSIEDTRALQMIGVLYQLFCTDAQTPEAMAAETHASKPKPPGAGS